MKTEGDVPRSPGPTEVPRSEAREAAVREVEYAPFPRVRRGEGWGRGFTRDLSRGGACLRTPAPVEAGSLLRVIVHGPDGSTALDSVGRVVWCRETAEGECRMGLSWLAARPGARRRRGSRPVEPTDSGSAPA